MPQFLTKEIQDYIKMLYGIGPNDLMFTVTKSYLHREMDQGAIEAAVLDELRRIEVGQDVNDELLDTIQMIATIMNGMQEDFAYDR